MSTSQYVCGRCGLPIHLFSGGTWRHTRGGRSTERPCGQAAMPVLRSLYEAGERAALKKALGMSQQRKRLLQLAIFQWAVTRDETTLRQAAEHVACSEEDARVAVVSGAPMDGAVLELREGDLLDAYYCDPQLKGE